jgi:chromosome segregation ATPase
MTLLGDLKSANRRSEPKIWVQRISLFRSLEPVSEIRSIPFRSGVNIVWGIEEEATSKSPFEPGHGVGKTTLCRLIRYCLGEAAFGQASTMDEVRRTFPKGYVAAEVRVSGVSWSVARPIGKQRLSFARQGVSIEALIKSESDESSFDQYMDAVRTCALSSLCSEGILSDGSSLHWEHVLSMCSRDQEARYQSLWNWRSERSDSKLKSYDLPRKVDAFHCMRTILGLLSDDEVKCRAELRQKAAELKALEGSMEAKRQEPEFTIRHLRRNLTERLDCKGVDEASMDRYDLLGLPKIVKDRKKALQGELAELLPQIGELNGQIRIAIKRITEPKEMLAGPLAEIARLKHAAQLLSGTTPEEESYRREMGEIEELPCEYGKVPLGQCCHIQQEMERIHKKNREHSLKNAKDIVQSEDDAAALKAEIKGTEAVVKSNSDVLKDLEAAKDDLIGKQKQLEEQIKELGNTFEGICEQEAFLHGHVEGTELAALTGTKVGLEGDVKAIKETLSTISTELRGTNGPVQQLFHAIVKAVLSPECIGALKVSLDEIEFTIQRQRSLSGEAFQTLGILLADIALLLTGAIGLSHHPCFLIHDSPREADLGINIYRHFISTMATLSHELRAGEHSPFQYIITTTTPPPEDLRAESYLLGAKHGTLLIDPLVVASDEYPTLPFGDQKS